MKILITGVAGFIGFNFAKHLLSKKYNIYGIDNFDNYYSPKFKHLRIKELKKSKKFNFKKIDITKKKILKKYFLNKEFDFIFHFAAQAGVRYSMINPRKYIRVNKEGFENIINNLDNIKRLKKVFMLRQAQFMVPEKFPSNENLRLFPQSIYAKTKLQNEIFAKKFQKKSYDLIGLRFLQFMVNGVDQICLYLKY